MKSLLKRLFPIVWLKGAFLIYNRIRLATIDKLIYARYVPGPQEVVHFREENPFLRMQIDLSSFSEKVRLGFSRWLKPSWVQDEFIVHIQHSVVIDAETGWGIVGKNKLVYESLGFSRALHVKKPGISRTDKVDKLKKIISLRDTGEENYFHFFNDVMPKLLLLRDRGIDLMDRHVVVSGKLWKREYFLQLRKQPPFSGLKWHIQDDRDVECSDVIFCKPITHHQGYWKELAEMLRQPADSTSPPKIFITRSKTSLRYLENGEAVEALLKRHGFVVVDPASLSFSQQMIAFAGVKELIAVHGAGTSNLAFSKYPVKLVEIFHNHPYLPFHYIMLSKLFNGQYHAIKGGKGDESGSGGFTANVEELRKFLE